MKVLVTGGAGFIGSHIVDKCVQNGFNVTVIDNFSTGKKEFVHPKATIYEADIRDERVFEIIQAEQPDVIIHHAAQIDVQKSLQSPAFDADVNIVGTVNLLKAAVRNNIKRIIYASSAAVYGVPEYLPIDEEHVKSPISFYGYSKYVPEKYIKMFSNLYGLEYVILRYANVYGIRQDPKGEGGVVSIFTDRILKNEPLTVFGDGKQTRDFIYVDDIAEANLCAINVRANQTFNISTNTPHTITDLIDVFKQVTGRDLEIIHREMRKGDILHSCLNNNKALSKLKWTPGFSLIDGISTTYEYYLSKTFI